MNNKNYISYLANREWSDKTIPEGIEIIAEEFKLDLNDDTTIEETSFYEDTRLSADLKITHRNNVSMIGYRSRSSKFIYEYPYDVTFRYRNKAGWETEFSKIMKGHGDFNLYTFTHDGSIVRWVFLNLHAFRKAHVYDDVNDSWSAQKCIKTQMCSNKRADDTDFISYNMLSIKHMDEYLVPEDKVIIAHSPGYFDDVKVTVLPTDTGRVVELYSIKDKKERKDGY